MFETKMIPVSLLVHNRGQIKGLPKNPRFIRDYRYEALKKSIQESPDMLKLRELIVFPYEGKYVVVCGDHRLRVGKELSYPEMPCKVLEEDTPADKLREYAIKDNNSYAENDKDLMSNEWDRSELENWGIEFEEEKPKDSFKERFNAIKDEDAVYPLVPRYDEKHELFIIQSENEVDSNWLRERLGMQKMQSYKTGKTGKSNVIHIRDVRTALEGGAA